VVLFNLKQEKAICGSPNRELERLLINSSLNVSQRLSLLRTVIRVTASELCSTRWYSKEPGALKRSRFAEITSFAASLHRLRTRVKEAIFGERGKSMVLIVQAIRSIPAFRRANTIVGNRRTKCTLSVERPIKCRRKPEKLTIENTYVQRDFT